MLCDEISVFEENHALNEIFKNEEIIQLEKERIIREEKEAIILKNKIELEKGF
jgi:hypothetical protein